MDRALLTPKWIIGAVLVIATAVLFANLGFWQLRRLDERRAFNDLVRDRTAAAALPLEQTLERYGADPDALDFRRVEATGRYVDGQLLTAPRSQAGRPGPHVLAVLATDAGPDMLVDRGWIPFTRDAAPPPTPSGEVRITGVLRTGEVGDIGQAAAVARIAPDQIADRLGRPLADVWLQLREQQPPVAAAAPAPTPLPELGEGSHLSYAIQWFSFATIALIGYPVLVWRAARDRRDTGVDDDAGPDDDQGGGGPGPPVGPRSGPRPEPAGAGVR